MVTDTNSGATVSTPSRGAEVDKNLSGRNGAGTVLPPAFAVVATFVLGEYVAVVMT